jgi:putative transposase
MPAIVRKAARGEVRLFNGIYFNKDLMLVDGEDVQVAYDIHDVSRVWVRKLSGELIAEAALGGNRDGYFPKPLIERLREDRAKRRMGRLQAQMNEVEAELQGDTLSTAPALEPLEIPAEPGNIVALPHQGAPRRPMFDSDAEKYRWLLDHTDEVATEDENWLTWYRATAEWQDVFGGGRRSGDDGDFEVAAR